MAASKIEKPIILDLEDKATTEPKPYTKENITAYEILTRDNRIGEITNAATSIENRYTTNEAVKKLYADYTSLLRIFQGKEIDFLKTGIRWHMNYGLRQHLKRLPYFLLFNYPDKLKKYRALSEKNKKAEDKEDQLLLNAYHSPSPMNELCQYICAREKKHILWDNASADLAAVRTLVLNSRLDLSDRHLARITRRYINAYADELRRHMKLNREKSKDKNFNLHIEETVKRFREKLSEELRLDEEHTANYCIMVSYQNLSISELPSQAEGSYEYLGKYYTFSAYLPTPNHGNITLLPQVPATCYFT